MSSIEHRSFRGTILGLLSFALNIVYSLLLVPFFLNYWGEVKYGYFLMAYAFIQILRTLDNGHQIYVGNEFNKYYHSNPKKAQNILGSSIFVAFTLGAIELLIFIGLWQLQGVDYILGKPVSGDIELFWGLFSMITMWLIVGSVGGILARIILAKGFYGESVLFAMVIKSIEIVIIILAIIGNLNISLTFILIAIATFLYSLYVFYWTAKKMPEYFPWWKGSDLLLGIMNFKKSIVLTLNGLFDQLSTNGLLFLITRYIGVASIPIYTTVRTLSNTITSLTNLMVQPLVPEMIRYESEKKHDKVAKIIQVNWFFGGIVINTSFLLFVPFAQWLFLVWTNNKLEFNESLFYALMLSVVVNNFGKGIQSYLSGINDLKSISILTVIRLLVIFGGSLLLIPGYGISSFGLAILISEIICSLILPLYFAHKIFKDEMFSVSVVATAILPLLIIGIIALMITYGDINIASTSLIGLLFILIVYKIQWDGIDSEIKSRIKNLLLTKVGKPSL